MGAKTYVGTRGKEQGLVWGFSVDKYHPVSLENVAWNWKLFLYINGTVLLYFYFNVG